MLKLKRVLFVLALLALPLALAAETSSIATSSDDVRISILESRVGRLESDVASLRSVPAQLARIETALDALTEKAGNNADVLQAVGLGIVLSVVTGALSYTAGKRRSGS